jgi:hypothetical protein
MDVGHLSSQQTVERFEAVSVIDPLYAIGAFLRC